MCTTCGCSSDTRHHHHHHDDRHHRRLLVVEQDLLSRNNQFAKANRDLLARHLVLALNFVSSPGAGKTLLLEQTIKALAMPDSIAVIEGDQQTDNDARRIQATGAKATQINTGKGCHLDAHAVGHAMAHFDLEALDYLFIENVGNLVCPAAFDLGELAKVVVLSVTEGDDKPLKYPDMFKAAALMLINKIDLLPYVDFDVEKCVDYARRINPEIEVIMVSAKTLEGLEFWKEWLHEKAGDVQSTTMKSA